MTTTYKAHGARSIEFSALELRELEDAVTVACKAAQDDVADGQNVSDINRLARLTLILERIEKARR